MSNHTIQSLGAWQSVAKALLKEAGETHLWTLHGNLGAGKTTLVKALCKALGVQEVVNSPTFSLVHHYPSPKGPIYHCDFHRLSSKEELLQIGFEDYLADHHYIFIEWPEHAYPFLDSYFEVRIGYLSPTSRSVAAHLVTMQI